MPKTLYLVRHAKSDWNTGNTDFDRPLNKRGRRDAPEMGRRLKDKDPLPEIIVCSPAKRATETHERLGLEIKTAFDERIYEATTGDLLDIVQSLDDKYASAMLVGHNPAMTWLASQLSGVRIDNMPTCAVAAIEIDSEHWKKAGSRPARLLDLDYPKKPA